MIDLAYIAQKIGYQRYWIAEHHNTSALVSSATSILIKHTLEHTNHIRVGSGGIMLPNRSPLVVASNLERWPRSILIDSTMDWPGAWYRDATANALRRSKNDSVYTFPEDVKSLLTYFGPEEQQSYVKAYPGVGTNIPLYILGCPLILHI